MKSVLAILLASCCLVLAVKERAAAQLVREPIPAPQVPETWLMLKNGSTFSARMLSAGERVKLRVNNGDIEVRASEIALTGYSLGDLAEQQWALLHQQQLDKQFPFIDWCARHHLYDHADAALAQMALAGQDPPRVRGYQVRVARLREIHQEQQAAAAQLAATPTTSPAPVQPATTAMPQQTQQPSVAATLAKPPANGYSGDVHDTSIANNKAVNNSPNPATLPPAAVELFAARVQPWVVSRCSNVGCHDMNSSNSFKLERYSKQEAIPRSTTLKNLAATTRLIVSEKPEESPLLVMSGRAHGTSLTPPLAAGDGPALAAFREFAGLATGRELPKEAKPDPASSSSLNNLPGHITPGRATFPASAADEPTAENKAAAVINQNSAGWQAAIERQKAYDAEAQKLKNLELNSQRANEARGLINNAPATAEQAHAVAEQKPAPAEQKPAQKTVTADLLLPHTNGPSLATPAPRNTLITPPELLGNVPAGTPLSDNDAAKSAIANQTPTAQPPSTTQPAYAAQPVNAVQPAAHYTEVPPVSPSTNMPSANSTPTNLTPPSSPHALPESLLPKSIAKSRLKPDALPLEEASQGSSSPQALPGTPATSRPASAISLKEQPAALPINLNRPRKRFPLPPEDTPPSPAQGTGEIKRR